MRRVALGFKFHTGWATMVAVAGESGEIQLLLRRRIELLRPEDSVPRFVYHQASEMPLPEATELIKRATVGCAKASRLAVQEALREVSSGAVRIDVCGILASSRSAPDDLAVILRSHPMIHTAEGALYRTAMVSACESSGLIVVLAGERDVWVRAAKAWRIAENDLRKKVDGLCKSLGPPWGADHKASTAIALLALKSARE